MNQQEIDRKRRLAEMLMQSRTPQMGRAGRFDVAPSTFAQIAPMIQALAGAHQAKQADQGQEELDQDTKAKLAQSLQALTGVNGPRNDVSPEKMAAVGALTQMPIEQQQQAVASLAGNQLGPGPAPIKLGQGDTLVDPNSYQTLASGPGKPGKLIPVMGPDGPILVDESDAAGRTPAPRGGVTVNNMGNIPTGYRLSEDGRSLEPIPGGPVDMQMQADAEAAANKSQFDEQKSNIVTQEIQRAFDLMDTESLPETGFIGNKLKNIEGTDAHQLQTFLTTIRSNVGFDRLQQMRDASPTGGALGNVSERELSDLQAVMGSLEQSQQEQELRYNLTRLNNMVLDVVHGPGNGPARAEMPVKQQAATEPNGPPAVGDIVDGYEFLGGNPGDPNNWKLK